MNPNRYFIVRIIHESYIDDSVYVESQVYECDHFPTDNEIATEFRRSSYKGIVSVVEITKEDADYLKNNP